MTVFYIAILLYCLAWVIMELRKPDDEEQEIINRMRIDLNDEQKEKES